MTVPTRRYGAQETHVAEWTEERETELRQLVSWRLTASQIAKELGGGVSRNGIIGKCARLGLKLGSKWAVPAADEKTATERRRQANKFNARAMLGKPVRAKTLPATRPKDAPAPKFSTVLLPAEIQPPPESVRVTFMELRATHCRWTLGDPAGLDTIYCGADAPIGEGPYCKFHRQIAYTPAKARKPLSAAERETLARATAKGRAQSAARAAGL